MGYDLSNEKGDCISFSSPMWSELRWIGEKWGWNPVGTYFLKDEDSYFDDHILHVGDRYGPYTGNNSQVVIVEDAFAWAAAIERALSDPDLHTILYCMHRENIADYTLASKGSNVTLRLWEYDKDQYEIIMRDFIEFCKNGAFVIS